MKEREDRLQQQILEVETQSMNKIMVCQDDFTNQISDQSRAFDEVKLACDKLQESHDKFALRMQKNMKLESQKIFDAMKADSEKLLSMECKVRLINKLDEKLDCVNQASEQNMLKIEQCRESLLFCERSAPMLVHLQIVEALQSVVQNEP